MSSRGMRVVALVVAVLLVIAPTGAASADDVVVVPDSATITITGDGSGHGIGMSQYGAYSAARKGRTYREILGFYYPRTRYARRGGQIRVRINHDDDRDLRVNAVRGLRIKALSSGRAWQPRPRRATQWRAVSSGRTSVISYRAGRWRVWRKVRGGVQFSAGRKPLTMHASPGPVRYRGALRSVRHSGSRITVNVLSLEQYLRGVVPSEMQAGWPRHALRAQAVAARTYAAFERGQWGRRSYDLCDTSACQAYGGVTAEHAASNDAVRATSQKVLTFRRKVAFAQYSASNGGFTVDGGRRYLPARGDRYEGTSKDYYGWTVSISASRIEQLYGLENLTAIRIATRDGNGRWGGRVTRLEVTTAGGDSPGTYPVDVDRFVSTFGLRSSLFKVISAD